MKQLERFKMIIKCWQYFQETLILHAFFYNKINKMYIYFVNKSVTSD